MEDTQKQFLEESIVKLRDISNLDKKNALIQLKDFFDEALEIFDINTDLNTQDEDENEDEFEEEDELKNESSYKYHRKLHKKYNRHYVLLVMIKHSLEQKVSNILSISLLHEADMTIIELASIIKKMRDLEQKDILQFLLNDFNSIIYPAKISYATTNLKENLCREIFNITTVKTIVKESNESKQILIDCSIFNDELYDLYNQVIERCVTYRANKKFAEMEIAEKSANYKKAEKLRKEAQALLEQDRKEFS